MSFEEAVDAWITNPGTSDQAITLYCVNETCPAEGEPVQGIAHTEYGHTTYDPDGCPDCGQPLEEEPLEVG